METLFAIRTQDPERLKAREGLVKKLTLKNVKQSNKSVFVAKYLMTQNCIQSMRTLIYIDKSGPFQGSNTSNR